MSTPIHPADHENNNFSFPSEPEPESESDPANEQLTNHLRAPWRSQNDTLRNPVIHHARSRDVVGDDETTDEEAVVINGDRFYDARQDDIPFIMPYQRHGNPGINQSNNNLGNVGTNTLNENFANPGIIPSNLNLSTRPPFLPMQSTRTATLEEQHAAVDRQTLFSAIHAGIGNFDGHMMNNNMPNIDNGHFPLMMVQPEGNNFNGFERNIGRGPIPWNIIPFGVPQVPAQHQHLHYNYRETLNLYGLSEPSMVARPFRYGPGPILGYPHYITPNESFVSYVSRIENDILNQRSAGVPTYEQYVESQLRNHQRQQVMEQQRNNQHEHREVHGNHNVWGAPQNDGFEQRYGQYPITSRPGIHITPQETVVSQPPEGSNRGVEDDEILQRMEIMYGRQGNNPSGGFRHTNRPRRRRNERTRRPREEPTHGNSGLAASSMEPQVGSRNSSALHQCAGHTTDQEESSNVEHEENENENENEDEEALVDPQVLEEADGATLAFISEQYVYLRNNETEQEAVPEDDQSSQISDGESR